VLFTQHHLAHAASAFYPSPFDEAAILIVDGVGEWATTSIGEGRSQNIKLHKQIHYPHSLGLLFSAFTYFCGFRVNYDEYKLMGLAPYGKPRYADRIWQHLIQMKPDGSFCINTDYFGYVDSNVMTNQEFHELFDGPPRSPESGITRREIDLAASVQKVLEHVLTKLAYHAKEVTGMENLVLAGGVALNCVAMGQLWRERIFRRMWIQPAAGDAGGALGAALLASYIDFGAARRVDPAGRDSQKGSYLGPAFSPAEVRAFLKRGQYPYETIEDRQDRAQRIAQTLADGGIVAYFSGRMEFGPRALGARSILADPRQTSTLLRINLRTKHRESFRPLAPTVLAERCEDYFDFSEDSPYMLLVVPVRRKHWERPDRKPSDLESESLLAIVQQPRSDIPAVTHVDHSARIQTIRKDDNRDFYEVVKAFERITGYSVILNTSFNIRGEPIVCTPLDAYKCFMSTDVDMLVMEDCLIQKSVAIQGGKPETLLNYEVSGRLRTEGLYERDLCSFFLEKLVPAAQKLRQRKVTLSSSDMNAKPEDGNIDSWYVLCAEEHHKLNKLNPANLGDGLRQLWSSQRLPELVSLVEPLVDLSQRLECSVSVDLGKPSPFIYAMF